MKLNLEELEKIDNVSASIGNCAGLIEDLVQQDPNLAVPQITVLEVICDLLNLQSKELAHIVNSIDRRNKA